MVGGTHMQTVMNVPHKSEAPSPTARSRANGLKRLHDALHAILLFRDSRWRKPQECEEFLDETGSGHKPLLSIFYNTRGRNLLDRYQTYHYSTPRAHHPQAE